MKIRESFLKINDSRSLKAPDLILKYEYKI